MTPGWMDAREDVCIRLRSGPHEAMVAPAAGGRILSLSSEMAIGRRDWLVPIRTTGWPADAWPKGGLFPLAPFSNRVRDGLLHWRGRILPLGRHQGQAHALHGHAQAAAWQVLDQSPDTVAMRYEHPPKGMGWPWPWRLDQRVRLMPEGLTVSLMLTNLSDEAMPAGLGLHPYFTATRVSLGARTLWEHKHELAIHARANEQSVWVRGQHTWTAFLADWDGVCVLEWDQGPGLRMETNQTLDHMVLHVQQGRYLCAEPVSHVCDAFNLAAAGAAGTGLRVLGAGQTMDAQCRLLWSPAALAGNLSPIQAS